MKKLLMICFFSKKSISIVTICLLLSNSSFTQTKENDSLSYEFMNDIRALFDSLIIFKDNNGKYGYKTLYGEVKIPAKYDYASKEFSNGVAIVNIGGKENAAYPGHVLGGKFGLIDKTGKEVTPLKYDYINSFSEGLAAVRLNDKYGYIDKTGNVIVPLKYEDARSFSEGFAQVKLDGKYGCIDQTGNVMIPLKYDFIYFSEGIAMVELNKKYGFVDSTGKEIVPVNYDHARSFSGGLAAVKLNGKWGFIDKEGKVIIRLKYDEVGDFNKRGFTYAYKHSSKKDFSKFELDKTGKETKIY